MKGPKLPLVIAVLLLAYMAFGVLRPSDPMPMGSSSVISVEQLASRHADLQRAAGRGIPLLAIITRDRPATLSRLLGSIDYKVEHLVIVQAGTNPDIPRLVSELQRGGTTVRHIQLPTTVGPAEMWNRAMQESSSVPGYLIVDDHVEFESGSLVKLHHVLETQARLAFNNDTRGVLLTPGRLSAATRLWECFVLLRAAVEKVGLFDPNFYPASQEGYDYLARLSRAGLWLQEMPDVRTKERLEDPSWMPTTEEQQRQQRRQEHGRPYFALKWGHSDTAGVYDSEGHWDKRCEPGSGRCSAAPPVLYAHPFNDPEVSLAYAPYDPALRSCIIGTKRDPCRFNRALVKHPKLLPQGEFDGRKYKEQDNAAPEREYKRFIYLIQGPKKHPSDPPLHESPDRDVVWLTYHDKSGDIYYPKSSWTQGRNRLLEVAMQRASEMPDGGYLYYIFLDGDVIVRSRQDTRLLYRLDLPPDPYDRFEVFLKDWEPAVGTVAYWWTLYDPTKLSVHHNNDAVFSAHHRETLSFGLPYVESLDCHSWYYSQHIMNSLNAMLYNTRRVQFNGMEARNEEHIAMYKREMMWLRPRCFALTSVLPSSPLRQALVQDPNPAFTPGQPTKRGEATYIVPIEHIVRHFNTSHPIVKRALAFRERPLVQALLNASRRVSPGKFMEDQRVCEKTGDKEHKCFDGDCPMDTQAACVAP